MTKQTPAELEVRQDASPVLPSTAEPLNATSAVCMRTEGLSSAGNSEERSRVDGSRPHVGAQNRHSVFVLDHEGRPLTPTTPTRARRLLRAGVAVPTWSKFNTFGIQLVAESRHEVPLTALGVDNGTKFEGYSVVVGDENSLNVKLDLPNKKHIVGKLEERHALRRARRWRNCRRRPQRSSNRTRRDWLAPSQVVIVGSRLRVISELVRVYPVRVAAIEDVRFNHAKHRWGSNFSTIEVGKERIRRFFGGRAIQIVEYRGYETQELRKKYDYRKTRNKSADKFTAHCADSLTLAVEVSTGMRIEPGRFLVVDDVYRCKRRRLHYTQPAKGGFRVLYSRGTVFGFRKGLLVGVPTGRIGRLCGELRGSYRYHDAQGKRRESCRLMWACGHFVVREAAHFLAVQVQRSPARKKHGV